MSRETWIRLVTAVVIAIVIIGIAVNRYWDSLQPDIAVECTTNADLASCTFYNNGTAAGSVCVKALLKRMDGVSDFNLNSLDTYITTTLICSGRLAPGEDAVRETRGYYSPTTGERVSATRFCGTKPKPVSLQACDLDYPIANRPR